MKAKVKDIVSAYKALGEAKVTKLEEVDKIKVLKARKAMRPIADDFDAFLKDCREKFKPDDWDTVQEKVAQWQKEGENTTLSEDERKSINKTLIAYQASIDNAIKDELNKEVEIEIEKLGEGSDVKLLSTNDWTPNQLNLIDVIL